MNCVTLLVTITDTTSPGHSRPETPAESEGIVTETSCLPFAAPAATGSASVSRTLASVSMSPANREVAA